MKNKTKEELIEIVDDLKRENTKLELRLEDENYYLEEENEDLKDEVKDLEKQVGDLEGELEELRDKYDNDIVFLDNYNYESLLKVVHEKLRHYSPTEIETYLKRIS